MRKLNKKAIEVFSLFMLSGFILLVGMIMGAPTIKQGDTKLDFIGKNQVEIKQLYEKAENDLFYNDQLAKYTTWDAIPRLSSNGGFKDIISCRQYPPQYCTIDPDNFPDYEESFELLFNNSFNNAFKNYFKKDANYIISIYDNLVVGIAKDTLRYNKEILNSTINYDIKPHFEIKLNYSFSDYEVIRKNAKALVIECSGKEKLKECVEGKVNTFTDNNLKWQPGGCQGDQPISNNKLAFCVFHVPERKKSRTFEGEKDVLYKFSLDFSPKQATQPQNTTTA